MTKELLFGTETSLLWIHHFCGELALFVAQQHGMNVWPFALCCSYLVYKEGQISCLPAPLVTQSFNIVINW